MRLTHTHRDAFVNAVLADTPKVDYQTECRKVIEQHLKDRMPPKIAAALKDPACAKYFAHNYVTWSSNPWGAMTFFAAPVAEHSRHGSYHITDVETVHKLNTLVDNHSAQRKQRAELETKLRAAINAFTTVKAARAALPEFAKYLPDPEKTVDRSVPAVANLVADLMAAGWPDEGKKK